MYHSFEVEIAKKYGISEAVLLNHIYFWIEKNKANKNNYYDGYYWTYNSTKAFSLLFPYISQRKIAKTLTKLEELELIITGNYNKSNYDRTKWYALTEMGTSIMQNGEMEHTDCANGTYQNEPMEHTESDQPIPVTNTDTKPYINTIYTAETFFEKCWALYPNKKGIDKVSDTCKKKRLLLGEEFERALDRFIKEKKGTDKQFIMYGSTFWNSGHADYLDANYEEEINIDKAEQKRELEKKLLKYGSYDDAFPHLSDYLKSKIDRARWNELRDMNDYEYDRAVI